MDVFARILGVSLLLLPFQSDAQSRMRTRARTKDRAHTTAVAPVPAQQQYYQAAYQHILQSPELKYWKRPCVVVFDSLIAAHQVLFSEVADPAQHYARTHQETRLLDSLNTLDEAAWHKPVYSPLTAALTPGSRAAKNCLIIMFSRLSNNMLQAEISDLNERKLTLNNVLTMFDQSHSYLFVFSPDGKITRVYTKHVSYN